MPITVRRYDNDSGDAETKPLTAADLLALLLDTQNPIPGDAVLHLSVPEVEYAPIADVVHEPSEDGPGVLLFEIDPESSVFKLLSSSELSLLPDHQS